MFDEDQWNILDLGFHIIDNSFGCKIWQMLSTNLLNFVLDLGLHIVDGILLLWFFGS